MKKLRVLVLCHDVIGSSMAGPGIRYKYIASVLGERFDVTLGVFSQENSSTNNVITINPEVDDFRKYFDSTDVIFAQWLSNDMINYARSIGRVLVFDLYAPVPIEYLASLEFSSKPITPQQDAEFEAVIDMYNHYLSVGQLFTCSNERQRDFWVGYLTANRAIRPSNFKNVDIFSKFVFSPMGVDSIPPRPERLLLRSSIKGIGKDDFVLLWTGGIWDWFDAQTVVKAVALLNDPRVKLVFLGTRHPNKLYKEETTETKKTRELAKKLKLLDKTVFFMDGWVPYEQRAAYFMDADAAIYADKESLETRFSHRTRVLDHFWAGLPTICSKGDYMSSLIENQGLGVVVEERTPEKFAEAIRTLHHKPRDYKKIKDSLAKHRRDLTWEKTLQPLVAYLESIDLQKAKKQIIGAYNSDTALQKQSPLTIKRRLRLSAKMLLLGR